jgi:hypothetical protein
MLRSPQLLSPSSSNRNSQFRKISSRLERYQSQQYERDFFDAIVNDGAVCRRAVRPRWKLPEQLLRTAG